MNKFYNRADVTKENLLSMIGDCIESSWMDSQLSSETEKILEKIYEGYEGVEDDISFILEKLNSKGSFGWNYPNPNLQDVEGIISQGEWYFQIEKRTAKVQVRHPGGNASKGSKTYSMTIPASWMKSMGVTEENREVELSFDGEKIIIEKGQ